VGATLPFRSGWSAGWAEAKGRVRITTWRNYEGTCRVLLVPRIGSVPIGRIGPGLIRGVLEDVATGHGARSASVAHAVLRTALESAVRAQVVPRNHAKDVKTPSVRRSTPEPWSIADGQRFLSSVRGTRDEALYTLAIRLGLRQGELLGLAWEDVNIDSSGDPTTLTRPCEITIRHTLIWVNGAPHLGPTKSEASHRRLRLSDSLIATLTRQRELQDAERAACEAAGQNYLDNGLVFAAPNGRPLRGDVLTHQFHRLSDQLSLRPVRFHDLRRLAAGLMIHSSRGNVAAAGLMLGHSRKSSLTADLYAYLPPEMAAGMVEGVERLLAEVGERLTGDETSDTNDQSDIGEVGTASSHNQSDRPSNEQMTMGFRANHARKRAPVGVVSDNS
jgi:integrase